MPEPIPERLFDWRENVEGRLLRIELMLDRIEVRTGQTGVFKGGNWEVSGRQIAQWVPGTTLPLGTSSEYVRLKDGSLEIRGGKFDIHTGESGARMQMDGSQMAAWNADNDQTLLIDFTTGDVTISGTFLIPDTYLLDDTGAWFEVPLGIFGTHIRFVSDVDDVDNAEVYGLFNFKKGNSPTTSNPNVYGQYVAVGDTTYTEAQLHIQSHNEDDSASWLIVMNADVGEDWFLLYNNNTPVLTILNNNNVGIMDVTPSYGLDVGTTANFQDVVTGIDLTEIENPASNKTFTMTDKTLTFQFTNPAGGVTFEYQGNATGHLVEINQDSGSPPSETHLLHIEADDPACLPLYLVQTNALPTYGYLTIGTSAVSGGDVLWVTPNQQLSIGNTTVYAKLQVEKNTGGVYDNTTLSFLAGDTDNSDNIYFIGNTLNVGFNHENNGSALWINYRGHNADTDYYRDVYIADGKGTALMWVDGSAAEVSTPFAHFVMPTYAGAPGSSPSDGALAVDTTNNRLYFRSNGSWQYGGGAGFGTVNTVKVGGVQVGDQDIVTLDFGPQFTVGETPDTEVNISLNYSNIDHDSLSGFVANEHVALPNTIASVLSDHNLAAHTTLGLFDQSSDVDHDATTNFVANEHINWTSASSNFSTSGTGALGGKLTVDVDTGGVWSSATVAAILGDIDSVDSLYVIGNTLNGCYSYANDGGTLWLNYRGHEAGTSYYRDLYIGDGKGNAVVAIDASTGEFFWRKRYFRVGDGAGTNNKYLFHRNYNDNDNHYFYSSASGWHWNTPDGLEWRLYMPSNTRTLEWHMESDYGSTYATIFEIYSDGDVWCLDNMSALSFTDRTPWPQGPALDEVKKFKGNGRKIDYSSMPERAITRRMRQVYRKNGKVIPPAQARDPEQEGALLPGIEVSEEEEIGRNLSYTVSLLTKAVQELTTRLEVLEAQKGGKIR